MKYGYTPMFCPKKNIVVVRSTAGIIVVISLDTMQIVKKFRFSEVDYAQDDGWCFSNDGQFLYNCECYKDSFYSRISIYETVEFNCIKRLFTEDSSLKLSEIEFDCAKNSLYVLGYRYVDDDSMVEHFVAQLANEVLVNTTYIECDEYDFIRTYKNLEHLGFTQYAFEASMLENEGYSLEQIKSKKIMISDYIKESV